MSTTTDVEMLEKQVSYLIDRAAISDLLIAFATAVDTKDWNGYADLFDEDGLTEIPVTLPDGSRVSHKGREGKAQWAANGLASFVYTHHMSTNHLITIDGDTATTTSYVQSVHRKSDDPSEVWELGGWYKCSIRRTADGWKFTHVRLDMVWEIGEHGPQIAAPPVA